MKTSFFLTRPVFLFSAALVLLASVSGAMAQPVPGRAGVAPAPKAAIKLIGKPAPSIKLPGKTSSTARPAPDATPKVIEVPLNKAQSIALSAPVANIVVGNEAVADVYFEASRPKDAFIIARSVGSTNVFFMDGKGRIIQQLEVRVIFDYEGIRQALSTLLPNEQIKVSVFRDSLFLSGKVRSATASANAVAIAQRFVNADTNVVNMLTLSGSQQVILQVRVSEMSRATRKNLTANSTLNAAFRSTAFSLSTTSPSPSISAFGSGTIATGLPGIGPTTFSALERQGLVKTLAEPTLTAISGETANFLSGGEFPFPTGRDANGNATFEFREYGISLDFTPVVMDRGRINLKITTEISALDSTNTVTIGNDEIQGLTQKRTETTIDLPSGGSLMISGLLQDDMTDTVSGFPFLKDVPILGALFRSQEFQRDETELVVTVTAYLAKPIDSGTRLSLPTDGFEPASDIDIYLLGRLHRQYAKGDLPIWSKFLKGPYGYIME